MKPKILKLPTQSHGVHHIAGKLLDRRVDVRLIGVGGNGSQMLSGLARLHIALVKLGHPGGLRVTVFDPDMVSESNVGRQLFYPADIGQPKAFVLVNRYNLSFGFDWIAEAEFFGERGDDLGNADIVISCVDTAKARRDIHDLIERHYRKPAYWLDLGNRQRDGQVILGQPTGSVGHGPAQMHKVSKSPKTREFLDSQRLPCVTDIFPDLLDPQLVEDNTPSCSLAEALQKQDLFINQHVSTWALQLMWKLFREGKIEHHGAFINLETGRVNPLWVPVFEEREKKRRRAA